MMHKILIFFLVFSIGFAALARSSCDKVIVSADPSYPPLHWYDGDALRGASVDVVSKIFSDLGVPYEVRFLGPFSRVLAAAKVGDIDVVTTLKETPDRQEYLRFSNLVFNNPVAVFIRVDHAMSYSKWADLIPYRGAIARGNLFGEAFDVFQKKSLHIEVTNTLENSFNMLAARRFDYVITGYYPGTAYLSVSPSGRDIKALRPFVSTTPNKIGFVTRSPCIKYLDAFNLRLDKLKKSGELNRILDKSSAQWRSHPYFQQ